MKHFAVVLAALGVVVLSVFSNAQSNLEVDMFLQPLLFVSKTLSSVDVKVGERVEATVTVSNYGQSPAFDVIVKDISGNNTMHTLTEETLPYGASITLRYEFTATTLGKYPINVAHVTYNLVKGDASSSQNSYSNMIREKDAYYRGSEVDDESLRGMISVLTRDQYARLHAHFYKEYVALIFLGCVPILFPYILLRVKQSQVDALLRRAKQTTKWDSHGPICDGTSYKADSSM